MYRKTFVRFLFQISSPRSRSSQIKTLHVLRSVNPLSGSSLSSYLKPGRCVEIVANFRCKGTKARLDYSKVPKLNEDDLQEQLVRGSGPGGQATNKTNNAVVLKHKPTGIVVKCHETRSAWDNKKRAREILTTKLDNLINGEDSVENQERALLASRTVKRDQKRKKMQMLKAACKEREGID